jgi:hypothetical protein
MPQKILTLDILRALGQELFRQARRPNDPRPDYGSGRCKLSLCQKQAQGGRMPGLEKFYISGFRVLGFKRQSRFDEFVYCSNILNLAAL